MLQLFDTMFLKLLLVACVVAVSYASRNPEEIRQWMLSKALSCTSSNVVSSKELQMLMNYKLPDTKSSNCFIACVLKRVEWLDEKGNYNIDATNKMAEMEYADDPTKLENAKKLFDLCKTVNDDAVTDGEEGCERAHNLAKCLIENSPQMGFDLTKI